MSKFDYATIQSKIYFTRLEPYFVKEKKVIPSRISTINDDPNSIRNLAMPQVKSLNKRFNTRLIVSKRSKIIDTKITTFDYLKDFKEKGWFVNLIDDSVNWVTPNKFHDIEIFKTLTSPTWAHFDKENINKSLATINSIIEKINSTDSKEFLYLNYTPSRILINRHEPMTQEEIEAEKQAIIIQKQKDKEFIEDFMYQKKHGISKLKVKVNKHITPKNKLETNIHTKFETPKKVENNPEIDTTFETTFEEEVNAETVNDIKIDVKAILKKETPLHTAPKQKIEVIVESAPELENVVLSSNNELEKESNDDSQAVVIDTYTLDE